MRPHAEHRTFPGSPSSINAAPVPEAGRPRRPGTRGTIGLPRALLYHKYHLFWEEFFRRLGCEVVVSPETNREIMARGVAAAVDESCLSVKIFLGHVDYLKDRVDYLFIPRLVSLHRGERLCVKFLALYDIVKNTFGDVNILSYTVDAHAPFRWAHGGLLRIGWRLTKNPLAVATAYARAARKEARGIRQRVDDQERRIARRATSRPLVLVVSHPYTTFDGFLGKPLIRFLERQGVDLIYADRVESERARALSTELSEDLPWTYHKEFLGAIQQYKNRIDGILFLVTFPCGPDSMVVSICQNTLSGLPLAVMTLDELQGEAGLKTRLESFADILKWKRRAAVP